MSDVDTLTLAEFLLARIAEDESVARAAGEPDMVEERKPSGKATGRLVPSGETLHDDAAGLAYYEGAADAAVEHIKRFGPARVLAECEAKEKLIDLHRRNSYQPTQCVACGAAENWEVRQYGPTYPCDTLRTLAEPYAAHPDYRDDWDEPGEAPDEDHLPPRLSAH